MMSQEGLTEPEIHKEETDMKLNRRAFIGASAAATAVLGAPSVLAMGAKPRVIVIGGGAGGATAARYLAKDSKGAIDVT